MSDGADQGITEEQKNYLQGFVAGFETRRAGAGLPTFASMFSLEANAGGIPLAAGNSPGPQGPESIHRTAQDRFLAEGKKLSVEEEAKRKKNPLDMWDELRAHAAEDRFPRGTDVFLFKFHGLFYVAPAQDAFMCRLRLPNGILSAHQLRGIAAIAEKYAGGYADVTTRANLQLREIQARDLERVLTSLHDLGIVPRGAGADNIRNVTGTPTAGIDPQELIDTRELAKELHHYILHHRELYGLPRKFNIAFDGGGTISALEDTNDIGFAAVRVAGGKRAPPGVYFRVQVGGITGHKDFGRDTGLLLDPAQCLPVAVAIVRVFIEHGDRTDRKKARLKYVLDRMGIESFVAETEKLLDFKARRLPPGDCEPRGPIEKHGHIGVHRQKQAGLSYLGVVLPAGRMSVEQIRGLSAVSERSGSGTIRLTVWQNLLISDIPDEQVSRVSREIEALELGSSATSVRGGLVACTGNKGCKYSSTDTKGHALELAKYLEARLTLDQPINIHFTGCPHSCAQHYIGDIGLLGTKVSSGDELLEGYHVFVGGGYATEGEIGREIGRELYRDVPFAELPPLLERMLRGFMATRTGKEESFRSFVLRQSSEELKEAFQQNELHAAGRLDGSLVPP